MEISAHSRTLNTYQSTLFSSFGYHSVDQESKRDVCCYQTQEDFLSFSFSPWHKSHLIHLSTFRPPLQCLEGRVLPCRPLRLWEPLLLFSVNRKLEASLARWGYLFLPWISAAVKPLTFAREDEASSAL